MAGAPASRPTRAERREQSQDSILEAAISLFAERGFDGVSLEEIASRSGTKRSLILYYYKSKDELWRVAAEEVARAFNARVSANLATVGLAGRQQTLQANLTAWLDAFLAESDLPRFLVREGGMAGPRLQWLIKHFQYSTLPQGNERLKRLLRGGILRDAMMAILLAMAALGPLMEASLSHVAKRKRSGIFPMSKKNREELVALMLRLLADTEAGASGDAPAPKPRARRSRPPAPPAA